MKKFLEACYFPWGLTTQNNPKLPLEESIKVSTIAGEKFQALESSSGNQIIVATPPEEFKELERSSDENSSTSRQMVGAYNLDRHDCRKKFPPETAQEIRCCPPEKLGHLLNYYCCCRIESRTTVGEKECEEIFHDAAIFTLLIAEIFEREPPEITRETTVDFLKKWIREAIALFAASPDHHFRAVQTILTCIRGCEELITHDFSLPHSRYPLLLYVKEWKRFMMRAIQSVPFSLWKEKGQCIDALFSLYSYISLKELEGIGKNGCDDKTRAVFLAIARGKASRSLTEAYRAYCDAKEILPLFSGPSFRYITGHSIPEIESEYYRSVCPKNIRILTFKAMGTFSPIRSEEIFLEEWGESPPLLSRPTTAIGGGCSGE